MSKKSALRSIQNILELEDKRDLLQKRVDEMDMEINEASERLLGVKPGDILTSTALSKAIYKVIEEYGDNG